MSDPKELDGVDLSEKSLTPEMKKKIDDLISMQIAAELKSSEIKEATTAIAAALGLKKNVFSARLNMIKKEKGSGGEVKSKNQDIIFVQNYFKIDDKS